jgi:hypothetical protein
MHSSNGIRHSTHNSFLVGLVSNGTSANRKELFSSLKMYKNESRNKVN